MTNVKNSLKHRRKFRSPEWGTRTLQTDYIQTDRRQTDGQHIANVNVSSGSLITNRKSHISFRMVPNSVTLDDLERGNSPNRSVISPNLVRLAFGADYIKVFEDTPILSAAEM